MICTIRDANINYEISGSGINVLMIHGFAVDHKLMKGCLDGLLPENKFRKIYIDLPGMGRSNAPASVASSDDILDLLIEFIDVVMPGEEMVLIGESYGGYLARGIHSRLKDRVIGLGLICPVIYADKSKRRLPRHEIVREDETFLKDLSPEKREKFSQSNVILNRYVHDRFKEEVLSGIKASDKKYLKTIQAEYVLGCDVDRHEEPVDIPTILLAGKQDSVVGYRDAMDIVGNYNRISFVILDEAGHNLQIEQAELFDSLMSHWLKNFI